MFTGIVEEIGIVKAIMPGANSIKLSIKANKVLTDTKLGDSIAVNGVCLTVTFLANDYFVADVMPESMRKTNMGLLKIGEKVNLERALTLNSRLGGHIVSGHIDGIAKIIEIQKEDNATRVTIKATDKILKYIISEGSVTLDGVSLTVATLNKDSFTVSLIPHTAEVTTLLNKSVGAVINVENDVIGKYVERLLNFTEVKKQEKPSLSLAFLRENGF